MIRTAAVTTRILSALIVTYGLGIGASAASAQELKHGVTVMDSSAAPLAKAKTYLWTASQPSPDKAVDALIVAAIDRELGALGLTKVASGKSDLTVAYISQRRTGVDLTAKAAPGSAPEYAVGTLLIDMRDAASRTPLFRARLDQPINTVPAQAEATIQAAVKALFEKYPTRPAAVR